jgi:hypothetical protein
MRYLDETLNEVPALNSKLNPKPTKFERLNHSKCHYFVG